MGVHRALLPSETQRSIPRAWLLLPVHATADAYPVVVRTDLWRRASRVLPSLIARFTGAALQLGLNLLLGRVLGPAGLGGYYLFDAWQRTAGLVAGVGMPSLTLRTISRLQAAGEANRARRSLGRYVAIAGGAGVAVGGGLIVASGVVATRWLGDPGLAPLVAWSGVAAVLYVLLRILAQSLKGAGRPAIGLVAEFVLLPAGLLVAVAGLAAGGLIDTLPVVVAHVAILVVAVVLAAFLAHRSLTPVRPASTARTDDPVVPLRTVAYFWGASVAQMVFITAPVLMLPLYASQEGVGLYGAATKLLAASGVTISALSSYFSPRFAVHAKNPRALRRLLRTSQVASLALFAPFFVLFVVAPSSALGLFGSGFDDGEMVLRILAVGQLVASGAGLVGYFAGMIDLERDAFASLGVSLVLLVLMTHLLGSRYGVVGVAVAYSLAVAVRSGSLYLVSVFRIGSAAEPPS